MQKDKSILPMSNHIVDELRRVRTGLKTGLDLVISPNLL